MHYVYIVRCADGTLYTGYARDPKRREDAHNAGRGAKYTAGRRPVSVIHVEPFASLGEALKREHQVKRWTREKKELLIRGAALVAVFVLALCSAPPAQAQITASARTATTPAWSKGIVPITPESYYNAIECGKQGGEDPPCVFWDTGLCKNDDFSMAMYTPYKMVAYEVWRVVRQKQPAPTPNYLQAQQTRITVGVTPVRGSKNAFADLVVKRGGRAVPAVARSLADGGGRYTFDYPAFAATGSVTLDLIGKVKTISCRIDQPVLAQFR